MIKNTLKRQIAEQLDFFKSCRLDRIIEVAENAKGNIKGGNYGQAVLNIRYIIAKCREMKREIG